ncbi:MAG TPA: type I-C CRISPR-associated endonuclease Cas1c [Kiritimatiellia bacterium]|nr:type I-C CRISPR-associated endonuclease Cas1c [Kiritimatiellia bacterium]HRZ12379.1 type I-C CRISPR-associated endonuclease Cas1c [Kiritimatiellia bacterium]HSA17863.1 type I-C CRISPR-associated endonuclease Cas1c [Kiritimatiellia bacterium]
MKKLLNTLFVTTQGAYLCHEGESVLVRVENEVRLRVPIHTIGGIVCFGLVSCSAPLMGLCGERGVRITHLSERGRFHARVEGPVSGNVLLRREQYRRADQPEAASALASSIVIGKIANSRTVLQRAARDHEGKGGMDDIERVVARLGSLLKELENDIPLDNLRGREGEAANLYFGVFDHLITAQKEDFKFVARSRRPPLDNINALLSFLYTLLVHDASAALETVGLDPQVGYLHALRPGRPALALDMIEEFRPFLADRLALSLVNLRQVQAGGFVKSESGAVVMDDETRKALLLAYQKRKQEEIYHPFIEEDVPVGLLFHVQALLMARHLRGDLDAYPPFLWR